MNRNGVAFDREEAALGLCCAAAPVFGQRHEIIAALSISVSTCRVDPEQMASAVKTASLSLSRVLAGGVEPGR